MLVCVCVSSFFECVCLHASVHAFLCRRVCVCAFVCAPVCWCVRVCVCVHACVRVHVSGYASLFGSIYVLVLCTCNKCTFFYSLKSIGLLVQKNHLVFLK